MQCVNSYTPAQRRIIKVYIRINKEVRLRGSALYREIAKELDYNLDKNKSHSYIRRTVVDYQNLVQHD